MLRYFPLTALASHQNYLGPSGKAPEAQQVLRVKVLSQSQGASIHLYIDAVCKPG